MKPLRPPESFALLAFNRFHQNQYRCLRLTSFLDGGPGYPIGDILRSVIVLTHASLEDLLRTIAKERLLRASPDLLKEKLPFPGQDSAKGYFAHLLAHRGKTVNDLIEISVNRYLSRMNLNDATEVAAFLELMEVDPRPFATDMAALDWMIKRRHQIVHQADIIGTEHGPVRFDRENMIAFFDGQEAVINLGTKLWPLVIWEFDPAFAPVPPGQDAINRIHGHLLSESRKRKADYLRNPLNFD